MPGPPILLSESLRAFAEADERTKAFAVEYFDGAIPGGDHVALVPTVAERVDAAALERLPRLKVVANYGVGYDNVDVAAARRRGVPVGNTPGVLTDATAELTWALILAATRRVGEGERLARSGEWTGWRPTQLLGRGLTGATLGVVGAGRIGAAVARKAPVFGMDVLYAGRRAAPELEAEVGARRVALDELLAAADVVSLHVPYTDATRHLIDAAALARMKPDAVLVNTARGAVIDEGALIDALREGRLRAAGLDVYEAEPEIPAALRELENVVLLPHLGSASEQARLAMWRRAWANLERGVAGQPLETPVA